MRRENGKKVVSFLLTVAFVAFLGAQQSFAASKKKNEQKIKKMSKEDTATLVKEEEGYYYGTGKGSAKEESELKAKKDLVENALTEILLEKDPDSDPVSVSEERILERFGQKAKFELVETNKKGSFVTFKMTCEEFQKEQLAYEETLRQALSPKYDSFVAGNNVAKKMEDASAILSELAATGETNLLTVTEGGTELFATRVENEVAKIVESLKFEISVKDGFVGPDTVYEISVKSAGKPVSDLTIKYVWTVEELPIQVAYTDFPEVTEFPKTDANGVVVVPYPASQSFRNRPVSLTVSTAVSTSKYATSTMRKLDAKTAVGSSYVHYDDVASYYKGVVVAPGAFNAGGLPQDAKAQPMREPFYEVETGAYEIGVTPVTNEAYAAYVFLTGCEAPEYFDNSDYNQATMPVTGITRAQAIEYAEWLSAQLGETYRLPTEVEWEKAARAGQEIVYPWGDDSPDKGKKANYNKNGKIKGLAPVGSFEIGNNAWGLVDMSGNIWEMTSSLHSIQTVAADDDEAVSEEPELVSEQEPEVTEYSAKGGSWMDGPTELRISNYRNIPVEEFSSELGFRLVKDVEWVEPESEETEESVEE